MNTVFWWIGVIAWACFSVSGSSLFVLLAAHACAALLERHDRRVRADERREAGNRLAAAAWWFSEDKPTLDLLFEAATDLRRGVDPLVDISQARERWRCARRQQSTVGGISDAV